MMRLGDDGSLDTVLVCDKCGVEDRYTFAESGFDDYEAFLEWAYENSAEEHICE